MVSEKYTLELKSIVGWMSTFKFILFSQLAIVSLILLSFFVQGYPRFIVHNLLLITVSSTIVISLSIFILSDYSVDRVGFLAGILLLSSFTLTILQVEWWLAYDSFEITIVLLLVTTIMSAAAGIYLIHNKIGNLSRRSIFMLTWIFSLFMILYFPLASYYLPFVTRERANVFVLFLAVIASTIFSILSIVNIKIKTDQIKWLDAGDMRRILGDTKGAEQNYRRALEVGPSEEVHTRLGDLFFTQGDHEQALSHYNRALGHLGDRNYRLAAISSSAIGLYANSITLIRQGLLVKTSPCNWYILGRMFKGAGEQELEPDCYREALAVDDAFWPAYAGLGEVAAEDESTEFDEMALNKGGYHPDKRYILKRIGGTGKFVPIFLHPADLTFWETESREIKSSTLRTMLEYILESLDITNTDVLEAADEALSEINDLGVIDLLTNTRHPDGIILKSIFRAAFHEDIDGPELESIADPVRQDLAYYIMGLVSGMDGECDKALRYLSNVKSIYIRPRALATRGCIFYLSDKAVEAKRNWLASLSLGYDGDELRESLSRFALEKGEIQQSHYFSRDVSPFPEIVLSDEEDKSVIEFIRRACVGSEENTLPDPASEYHRFAGAFKFLKGEYTSAEEHFNVVLKQDRDDADGHLGRGISLLGKRKFKLALEEFQSALELNDSDPLYYFYRGIALFRLGKNKKALADFKTVFIYRPGWDRNNHYISVCIGSEN